MTTTYDPHDPRYLDPDDLREELNRVYDLCHGCRLCFKFCTAFPTLFDFIDRHEDQDSRRLTDDERFQVVEECFQCKLCYINCPYTPRQHEWAIDFPRLMLRADAVRHRTRVSVRERVTDQVLGRTDLTGRVNTRLAGVVNRVLTNPGTTVRRLMEATVGISAQRVLPPYARERFTVWFRKRSETAGSPPDGGDGGDIQGTVAVFPTCLVEYQAPEVGRALVGVYEHNRVVCEVPDGLRCCGAPWLHNGQIERFVEQGRSNVRILAEQVRRGLDVVVPQPTCSYVLKRDYPDYVGGEDARLVAEHTYDACEYLWDRIHKGEGTELVQDFPGEVPATIAYHAPCHLRAQEIGLRSRDLLKRTGAKVTVVAECSGIDGTWGYRAENYERSRRVARKMADAIGAADAEVVAGDCHLANGGIAEETGRSPLHPLQILARAYGLEP